MKVLVTGASGFIGSAACRALLARGDEVHAVSRRPPAGAADPLAAPQAIWHACDLSQRSAVAELLGRTSPEAVLHLAGEVIGSRAAGASASAFATTLGSTVHLLGLLAEEPLRQTVKRVVLAGSLEEPTPSLGKPDPVPCSPYAAAKAAARQWARLAHRSWGVPVVWARLFMVYGPGQRDRSKLIPAACLALLRGEPFAMSSGRRPVDWIYLDDVVAGLLGCLDRPGLEGLEVDLGSGDLVTVRGVVERLHALVPDAPVPRFGALPDRPDEVIRAADLTLAQRHLAWQPGVDLDSGLARTLDWFRTPQEVSDS